MFKILIGFNKGILTMTKPWQVWMVFLVAANLVLPFFFLGTPEATVVLAGAGVGMVIMMTLFAKFGYVKLLGLGHIPWFFTVPWLWSRLGQTIEGGSFYYWLLAVIVLDSISLVIDTVDVVRYWKGHRSPAITV
ncbi:MAG: hypothetical protein NPINA01_04480 [Nitrospinaceae bacterium]|nr:MAG: hypothetical protein NPINA01_04480 [Nitrospinaceae bacterium]